MRKFKRIVLAVVSPIFLCLASSRAQEEPPAGGLYQIISGRYAECCGIAGMFLFALPDTDQQYVEVTVDLQGNLAQIAFLGEDVHTVFKTAPGGPGTGFTFWFTNGVMFPDHIQFDSPIRVPENFEDPSWSYTVSNFSGGLRIHGVARAPILGGADIPEQFEHTNLVAFLISTVSRPTIGRPRIAANGAIQFTVIDGRWGQTNVIEASTNLSNWTAISTNVFANGFVLLVPLAAWLLLRHRHLEETLPLAVGGAE